MQSSQISDAECIIHALPAHKSRPVIKIKRVSLLFRRGYSRGKFFFLWRHLTPIGLSRGGGYTCFVFASVYSGGNGKSKVLHRHFRRPHSRTAYLGRCCRMQKRRMKYRVCGHDAWNSSFENGFEYTGGPPVSIYSCKSFRFRCHRENNNSS